jgi:hypothetical protein
VSQIQIRNYFLKSFISTQKNQSTVAKLMASSVWQEKLPVAVLVSKSTLQSEHGNCAMAHLLHRITWDSKMSYFLTSIRSSMLLLSKHVAQTTSTQVFHFRVSVLFLKVSKLLGFRSLPMN